jgi:hypothetical protein
LDAVLQKMDYILAKALTTGSRPIRWDRLRTRANWGKTVTFAKIPGDSVFEEYKQKNDDEIQHIKMYLYEKCVRASEQ